MEKLSLLTYISSRPRRRGSLVLFAVVAGLAALSLAPHRAARADSTSTQSSASQELLLDDDQMVVTAAKSVQRISDAPSAVTVIDEETIRLSGATNVPDLLRLVPGINVIEMNQSETDVSIRGFNQFLSNTLLVMIDGRAIYRPLYGTVFWNNLPVLMSQIKRIEIVRGPGSALYGANAFNGVINIITKSPRELLDPKHEANIWAAAGSHNSSYNEALVTTGSAKDWALTVGGQYETTNGYGDRKSGGIVDAYRVPSLVVDAQKQLPLGTLRISAGGTQPDMSYSDQYVYSQDELWGSYYASVAYDLDRLRNPVQVNMFVDSSRFVTMTAIDHDRTFDMDVQQHVASGLHDLVYGGSYRYSTSLASATGPSWHGAGLYSLYAEDQYRLARETNAFLGARFDDQSTYGTNFTPRVGIVQHLPESQTLRLSYSTAFLAPTAAQTYLNYSLPIGNELTLTELGNSKLRPEQMESLEACYRKDFGQGYAALTAYDNWVRDLIETVATEFAPAPYPPGIPIQEMNENVERANARGIEFESQVPLARGLTGMFDYAYEYLHDQFGNQIDLTPRNSGSATLKGDLGRRLTGYLSIQSVGATYLAQDSPLPNLPIPSYTDTDLRFGYRLSGPERHQFVSIGATNLFNVVHYEYPASIRGAVGQPVSADLSRTIWLTFEDRP
jgi:iron complex outermembrane receptor protein